MFDCFQEALINKVDEFIMSVTTTLPPLFMRSLLFIFANLFHRWGDVHGGGMFFLCVQTTKSKERGERGKQDKRNKRKEKRKKENEINPVFSLF